MKNLLIFVQIKQLDSQPIEIVYFRLINTTLKSNYKKNHLTWKVH